MGSTQTTYKYTCIESEWSREYLCPYIDLYVHAIMYVHKGCMARRLETRIHSSCMYRTHGKFSCTSFTYITLDVFSVDVAFSQGALQICERVFRSNRNCYNQPRLSCFGLFNQFHASIYVCSYTVRNEHIHACVRACVQCRVYISNSSSINHAPFLSSVRWESLPHGTLILSWWIPWPLHHQPGSLLWGSASSFDQTGTCVFMQISVCLYMRGIHRVCTVATTRRRRGA